MPVLTISSADGLAATALFAILGILTDVDRMSCPEDEDTLLVGHLAPKNSLLWALVLQPSGMECMDPLRHMSPKHDPQDPNKPDDRWPLPPSFNESGYICRFYLPPAVGYDRAPNLGAPLGSVEHCSTCGPYPPPLARQYSGRCCCWFLNPSCPST